MPVNQKKDIDSICLISSERRLLYISTPLKSKFGWAAEGRHCYNYYYQREDPCPNCPWNKDLTDGDWISLQRKIADGSTVMVCHSRTAISGRDYAIEYFPNNNDPECSKSDPDKNRRKAMDLLMRSIVRDHRRTNVIMDNIPSIVVGAHPGGSVYFISPSVHKTGWTAGELLGKDWWLRTFDTPDQGLKMLSVLKDLWSEQEYDSGTNTRQFRFKDGSLHTFEWHIIKTKAGNIIAIGDDVTDELSLRQNLSERKHDLELLFYHISHDLRGPVSSAMGINNILSQLSDERVAPLAGMMKSSLEKLDYLIRDMHNIAGTLIDPVMLLEVKMAEIFSALRTNFRERLDRTGVQLIVSNKAIRSFYSDSNMIYLLLEQLIKNSITFRRPAQGLFAKGQFPWVKVYAGFTRRGLHICVRDNGKGIPQKELKHIFEMFQIGERTDKGTGLGLYLAGHIVEKLNGSITLKSKSRVGTTVDILLPDLTGCQ